MIEFIIKIGNRIIRTIVSGSFNRPFPVKEGMVNDSPTQLDSSEFYEEARRKVFELSGSMAVFEKIVRTYEGRFDADRDNIRR